MENVMYITKVILVMWFQLQTDLMRSIRPYLVSVQVVHPYSSIDTTAHYLDTNLKAEEEARRQLHKNVESSIEQVLAATPHKAPTIRPPACHHENYTS